MKAIQLNDAMNGLEISNITCTKPEPYETSVKLSAAALNHRDIWITKGKYPGLKAGVVLGSDGAGWIGDIEVVINPSLMWGNQQEYQSSDFQVLGMPSNGTFAEHIVIDRSNIYDKPEHLSMQEAAALPLAGLTAYRVLFTRCRVHGEDKVLISGIGGGVALMAAQMAIARGHKVFVTTGSKEKLKKAIDLGAAGGVIYKDEDWYQQLKEMTGGVDVVIDSAGGPSFKHFVKLCNPGARIGFYGAGQGNWTDINPQILFWKQISILGSTMGSDQDFTDMLTFVNKHKICPVIDSIYEIDNIDLAFERMEQGLQFGKIVINISKEK